jgi:hypothetical protein
LKPAVEKEARRLALLQQPHRQETRTALLVGVGERSADDGQTWWLPQRRRKVLVG